MITAILFVSRHFRLFSWLGFLVAVIERGADYIIDGSELDVRREFFLTHYMANYIDHGFAKRAVVGTILRPFTNGSADPGMWLPWVMLGLALGALLFLQRMISGSFPHTEGSLSVATLLRVAFAIGALGAPQIGLEFGRFDQINYIVLGVALLSVTRRRYVLAGLVGCLGVLVHEAFAVYGLPLILAAIFTVSRNPNPVRDVLIPAAFMVVTCLAILIFGSSPQAAQIETGIAGYIWMRGVFEYHTGFNPLQYAILTWFWLALIAVLVLTYQASRRRIDALFVASLAPFLLNAFGLDHGRWISIAFVVLLLNFAFQAKTTRPTPVSLGPWQVRFMCILMLPLGPIGSGEPLAWF